ncbi:hypothetical protein LTR84_000460 [Exophiala bonariae]|uniref:Uncharacterized protein n=1 Tax=Exophiala bonariae TaxID=1690606 RepID=A0AAV9NQL4_9EURO|nr:hypothetical protein LTR84_000460 [Exophiala bonariae]
MIGNESATSKSAIALFIFLGVALLFVPCMYIIIVKFRRSRKHRAQNKAEEGNAEYWAEMAANKPQLPVVAQPKKTLPMVYRNESGYFERPALKADGTYEAPKSFLQELQREEEALKEGRHTQFETLYFAGATRPVTPPLPPAAHTQYPFAQAESRLLTPFQQPEAIVLPDAPKPRKSVKSKIEEEGTAVQFVSRGRAGVGNPDRVRSKVAHIDDASLEEVDFHSHTKAPPGWI